MTSNYSKMGIYNIRKIVLSVILFTSLIFSQNPQNNFERISIEEGLSQSEVSQIVQDSTGYLWIATRDGLNRYDGISFRIFKSDAYDSLSLISNTIETLLFDKKDKLWVGTDHGVNTYNKYEENFEEVPFITNGEGENNPYVSVLYEKENNILAGTDNGLFQFDKTKNKFIPYSQIDTRYKANEEAVYTMLLDSKNNFWIGTSNGLIKLKKGGGLTRYTYDINDNKSLSSNEIKKLYEDSAGRIWIGTFDKGLCLYNSDNDNFIRIKHDPNNSFSISNNSVTDIIEDNKKRIWISTLGGGLNLLLSDNKSNFKFSRYNNDAQNINSISVDKLNSLYIDRSNILWISSWNGINKLKLSKKKFIHYYNDKSSGNSLSNNSVSPLLEDLSGNIWIGTIGGGLNKLDLSKQKFTLYSYSPNNPNSISDDFVTSITQQNKDILWVSTLGYGFNKFNVSQESFVRYIFEPQSNSIIKVNNPHALNFDKDKNNILKLLTVNNILWIGSQDGLIKYDTKADTVEYYSTESVQAKLSSNLITNLYYDKKRNLWISTIRGLNKLDIATNEITTFFHSQSDSNSIPSNFIYCITQDNEGNYWIGTNFGFSKLSFSNGKANFKNYNEKDGLPNNKTLAILIDYNGYVWVSTNKGLAKFDPNKESFTVYTSEDGLQSDEFNYASAAKCRDGRLMFGGINGFNIFHPDSIKPNSIIPEVALTDFYLFNERVKISDKGILHNAINYSKKITLDYDQNYIAFNFAALEYSVPDKNQFAYKLEGLEDSWKYSGNRNYANYTDLDPGEYTFHVIASNEDRVWNKTGKKLAITIEPPFWMTFWFKALIVAFFITSGLSYYFYRVNKLKREQVKLEKTIDERTVELREEKLKTEKALVETEKARATAEEATQLKTKLLGIAAHDLKNPLSSIIGFGNLVEKELPEKSNSREYIKVIENSAQTMLELISQLLNSTAIETGRIELKKKEFCFNRLANRLVEEFANSANVKKQELVFTNPKTNYWVIGDEERTKEVLANLLSNAIKYSPYHQNIFIKLLVDHDNLVFSVKDEGPGLTEDDKNKVFGRFQKLTAKPTGGEHSSGLGLSIAKQLIEMQGGSIGVESEQGKGAEFFISIPIVKSEEIETKESNEVTEPELNSVKILVVEDLEENRLLIDEFLKEISSKVKFANNGLEALEEIKKYKPDIILSDINMPVMDGFELINVIKNTKQFSSIPVVAVTAESEERVLEAGFNSIVTKPIDPSKMKQEIMILTKS